MLIPDHIPSLSNLIQRRPSVLKIKTLSPWPTKPPWLVWVLLPLLCSQWSSPCSGYSDPVASLCFCNRLGLCTCYSFSLSLGCCHSALSCFCPIMNILDQICPPQLGLLWPTQLVMPLLFACFLSAPPKPSPPYIGEHYRPWTQLCPKHLVSWWPRTNSSACLYWKMNQ